MFSLSLSWTSCLKTVEWRALMFSLSLGWTSCLKTVKLPIIWDPSMLKWHHRDDTGILDSGWHWTFQQYHKKAGMYVLDLKTLMDLELAWGIVIASQEKDEFTQCPLGKVTPIYKYKFQIHFMINRTNIENVCGCDPGISVVLPSSKQLLQLMLSKICNSLVEVITS